MSKRGENIYKRRDGRWEGRFFSGIWTNGKKKYVSVYGHSYNEVKNKLIKQRQSEVIHTAKLTFENAANQWLTYTKLHIKPSTFANYTYLLNRHIKPFFSKINMCSLSKSHISQFMREKLENGRLKREGGISKKYFRDMLSIVKSIASFCEQEYDIPNKIRYVKALSPEKKEKTILNKNEQNILTTYIIENLSHDTLAILISLYTGIRIGEVCGLKWEDFNEKENTIHIKRTVQRISENNGKTKVIIDLPKTQNSLRIIPIPPFLGVIMQKMKSSNNNFIVSDDTKPTEPAQLRRRFRQILNLCNLPEIRYHDLRHLFASNCVQLKFDIKSLSEILGHNNISMTLNRYVHSSLDIKREYMNLITI